MPNVIRLCDVCLAPCGGACMQRRAHPVTVAAIEAAEAEARAQIAADVASRPEYARQASRPQPPKLKRACHWYPCRKTFQPRHPNDKYCSDSCRAAASRAQDRRGVRART